MKKYYVKLGNMYLREIYTSHEYLENYFIREIDFRIYNEHAYIIRENEKGTIIKILEDVLKLSGTLANSITFEEVKEDE